MVKNIYRRFLREKWNIGFVANDIESILRGDHLNIEWLNHSFNDRWFADPFVLEVTDDKIYLLVEEFYYPINKGRISKMIINRHNYTIEDLSIVLELETHLSFPAILRKNEDIYIYPENSASGKLIIYKYNLIDNSCIAIDYLSDEPLTDAIYVDYKDSKYIFSTKLPYPNNNILYIYKKDNDSNHFVYNHLIRFKECMARNAGDCFLFNKEIYRPAQTCKYRYGYSICIQKIIRKNDEFEFLDIRHIYPEDSCWNLGTHTFNLYKSIIVVDAKSYVYPHIAKCMFKIKSLFEYIYRKK